MMALCKGDEVEVDDGAKRLRRGRWKKNDDVEEMEDGAGAPGGEESIYRIFNGRIGG